MIEASCHCGAIRMQVERPQRLTSCNCSFCRRHGAVWAYYDASHVAFMSGAGMTVPHIQGDHTLATHHCPICGCITHWESLHMPGEAARIAVNTRLMDPAEPADVPVRRFDGASTWTYLD